MMLWTKSDQARARAAGWCLGSLQGGFFRVFRDGILHRTCPDDLEQPDNLPTSPFRDEEECVSRVLGMALGDEGADAHKAILMCMGYPGVVE